MVEITKTLYVPTREAWRKWLEKNHDRATEIWLIYPKKNSGKRRVAYADAVEEALCFGWIDGLTKPVDEFRYAQRFSPRRPRSKWSLINCERYERMVREGRMTPAGLTKPPDRTRVTISVKDRSNAVPVYIERALKKEKEVWAKFQKIPPSHRRNYVAWIEEAKKEETRARRIEQTIARLKQ